MKNNNHKKRKKSKGFQEEYDSEQLAELGIFPEDDGDIEDEDQEFWRNYI